MIETIKNVLLIALIFETYIVVTYISNNFALFIVVTSESMELTFKIGDLINVKGIVPADISVGDTIRFRPPASYIHMTLITPNTIRINQTFTVQLRIASRGLLVQNALIDWTALGGVMISEENLTNTNGVTEANIIQRYDQLRLIAGASK